MADIPPMNGSFLAGELSQIQEKKQLNAESHDSNSHLKSHLNLSHIKSDSNVIDSEIHFSNVQKAASTSSVKVNGGQILQRSVIPITSHVPSYTMASDGLSSSSSSATKVLSGHSSLIPASIQSSMSVPEIEPGTIFSSSGSMVAPTSSNGNISQAVQVFQPPSFENCENVLSQQGNQAFLLTPSGTVISSSIANQGQVFLQSDNIVGVPLSSAASHFTSTNSESQFSNSIPFIQGTSQSGTSNSVPTRIIIQTNQPSGSSVSQPILSSNNHYLIQVGNNYVPSNSNSGNLSFNSKGHIVIKSGTNKIKAEPQDLSSQSSKDGIFRVVIPEGTTKISRPSQPVSADNVELKKYVQINVSNTPLRTLQGQTILDNAETQTVDKPLGPAIPEKPKGPTSRKLYECSICNSKFMRPLYLRMHMRSCKKPEVKVEKTPLFMCSFCKSTFKSKQQINSHFQTCQQSPYRNNQLNQTINEPPHKKGKLTETNPTLEQAVQYKCQDCDRTFSKERQYTSHIKRCTKISVHDLSGAAKTENIGEEHHEEEGDSTEDPFADPPAPVAPPKRGRGGSGRRGRPPGRISSNLKVSTSKTNTLFEGDKLISRSKGLVVADNENLVRSTTGLAHTVQLTLDMMSPHQSVPLSALVADSKGVRGRERPPQAWSLVCSLCQKMFLTKAALASHVITNHGSELHSTKSSLLGKSAEVKESYRCPLCMHHYNTADGFVEHLVLQHTSRLQECYANLQSQTGSFVCSLCSLVLLTKTLLLEHLSLEHLDELESCTQTQQHQHKSSNVYVHPGIKAKLEPDQDDDDDLSNQEKWNFESSPPPSQSQNSWDANLPEIKPDVEPSLYECGFCGDQIMSHDQMIEHYTDVHGVETDTDGTLLDLGIDVDIKVKDTKGLIHMANGKIDEKSSNLPNKTVLMRKKPTQNWQCQNCMQIFNLQSSYIKHVREYCGTQVETSPSTDSVFFCPVRDCTHPTFHQVKSLFKHMEDAHVLNVHRARKSFKQLSFFNHWLEQEEKKANVKFVKENAKYERNNIKLIQMVCQKFHSAKMEQAKEKEAELSKPTKKRWSVRAQRPNNCLARIHLRIEYNESTNDYDGETRMIYYPDHSHSDEEENVDAIDKIMIRHPKARALGLKNNVPMNRENDALGGLDSDSLESGPGTLTDPQVIDPLSFSTNEGDVPFSESVASRISCTSPFITDGIHPDISHESVSPNSPLMLQEKLAPKKKAKYLDETTSPISTPLNIHSMNKTVTSSPLILSNSAAISLPEPNQVESTGIPVSSNAIIISSNTGKMILQDKTESQSSLLVQNDIISSSSASPCEARGAKAALVDNNAVGSFIFQENDIVMGIDSQPNSETRETNTSGGGGPPVAQQEEYILPADESEWVKLFDVLKARMNAAELTADERKEAEAVIAYQNVISVISLHEQVSIFQKLCTLTNTSLESV